MVELDLGRGNKEENGSGKVSFAFSAWNWLLTFLISTCCRREELRRREGAKRQTQKVKASKRRFAETTHEAGRELA